MTNPFAGISNPAALRAMVQDGVKCKECGGRLVVSNRVSGNHPFVSHCSICNGSGHIPLPNDDLDALTEAMEGDSDAGD